MRKMTAFLLAAVLLCMCGCGAREDVELAEPVQEQSLPAPTEAPTEVPAEVVIEPPVRTPTEEPTEVPTEPVIQWLHSGIREDGSFSEGTLFIGDSLTYGLVDSYLKDHNLLGDAYYMAMPGATPAVYFYGPSLRSGSATFSHYSQRFEGLLMCEGVEDVGAEISAVYFMMGTNHSEAVTVQLYVDIIQHLLEHCPNATIYLQRVPQESSELVNGTKANERIEHAYMQFVETEEPRLMLVDTETAIGNNQTTDGIHLTEKGQQLWYEELLRYAADNKIPQ